MITFWEMNDTSVIVPIFAMTTAICGIGHALFRSKPRDYLMKWIDVKRAITREVMQTLGNQTQNRIIEDGQEKLIVDHAKLAARRPQFRRLNKRLLLLDLLRYLCGCVFCQSAWVAAALFLCLEPFSLIDFVLTVPTYAIMSAWMIEVVSRIPGVPMMPPQGGRRSGGCGG